MVKEMEVKLTPTQTRVGQEVLDDLDKFRERGERGVVVLGGLSGTGKSVLVAALTPEIEQRRGLAIQSDIPLNHIGERNGEGFQGSYVAMTSPAAKAELVEGLRKRGLEVQPRILRGMDRTESEQYVIASGLKGVLPVEEVAHLSLGVSLLAGQIARPGITESSAIRLVAQYLRRNIPFAYNQGRLRAVTDEYLQMEPPAEVIREIHNLAGMGSDRVYDNLHNVLKRQVLQENQSGPMVSPLFVASQSEQIYDSICATQNRTTIEIYAPGIGAKDLETIGNELGYNDFWQRLDINDAPRAKSFGATSRKFSAVLKNSGKVAEHIDGADTIRWTTESAEKFAKLLNDGELPLSVEADGDEQSLYIHVHDHDRSGKRGQPDSLVAMVDNPVAVGWMTESLLQQLGVAYVVDNYAYGARYVYHPEDKRIEIIKELD